MSDLTKTYINQNKNIHKWWYTDIMSHLHDGCKLLLFLVAVEYLHYGYTDIEVPKATLCRNIHYAFIFLYVL